MEQLESDLRDHLISSLQDNPNLDLDGLMKIGSGFMANDILSGGYAQRVAANTQAQAASGDDVVTSNTSGWGDGGHFMKVGQSSGDPIPRSPHAPMNPASHGVPSAINQDESDAQSGDAQDENNEGDDADNSPTRERLDIDKDITQKRFKNLEHGDLSHVNAIVLHRTNTGTGQGVLNAYGAGQKTGAHFLIDEDGKIYQTADLTKRAWHVGNIKRKCEDEGTCADEDAVAARRILAQKGKGLRGKLVDQTNWEVNTKDYPERYPYNGDSFGIEVVGKFDSKTKQFAPPTEAQMKSIRRLVASLQKKYGLTDDDVYTHGGISYKQESEGQGLGYDE